MDTMSAVLLLVSTVIMIPLNGLLLMLSVKIFKVVDQSYKTAIQIAALLGAVGFVFNLIGTINIAWVQIMNAVSFVVASIVLAILVIKKIYELSWGSALLVWLVWAVFSAIVTFVIAFIMGIVALAIGISAAVSTVSKAGAVLN